MLSRLRNPVVLLVAAIVGAATVLSNATAAATSVDSTGLVVANMQLGSERVPAGGQALLAMSLHNQAQHAHSGPVQVVFPDLPDSVAVRPAPSQEDVTCENRECTWSGALGPDSVTQLRLVAAVDRSQSAGARLGFSAHPKNAPADSAAVTFVVTKAGKARPQLQLRLTPTELPVMRGERQQFVLAVTNVAGKTARSVRVSDIVSRSVATGATGKGPGWLCQDQGGLTCSSKQPLAVGSSSSVRVVAQLKRNLQANQVGTPSAKVGRYGEVRWESTVTTAGRSQQHRHSLLTQLRAPIDRSATEKAPDVPDWLTKPFLEADLNTVREVRKGGTGLLEFTPLFNGVKKTSGATRVKLALPSGIAIAKVSGSQWRCIVQAQQRQALCTLPRAISAERLAPAIKVQIRGSKSLSSRDKLRATAAVSWRSAEGRHHDRSSLAIKPQQRLRVSATTSDRAILATPTGPGAKNVRQVQVQAVVSGIDEQQPPSYQWKQVAGPKVRWVGVRSGTHSYDQPAATFRVPAVNEVAKVQLEIKVTAAGATATDRVSVKLLPRQLAQLKPRVAATKEAVAGATGPQPIPDRTNWVGHTPKSPFAIHINAKKDNTVLLPGQTKKLRARVVGVSQPKYRWEVESGPRRMLVGSTQGQVAKIRAPRKPGVYLVELKVRSNGREVTRHEVIHVPASQTARSVNKSTAETRISSAASRFCSLFDTAKQGAVNDGVTVNKGMGTLTPGSVSVAGSDCSDGSAAINFTSGALQLGSHSFSGVTGQLTANGVSFTQGTFNPPGNWGQMLSSLGVKNLTFSLPTNSAITAGWQGSDLGALAGSVTFNEFLFLKLPQGWSGQTTISFTKSAQQPLAISANASGSAGSGEAGSVAITGSLGRDGTFTVSAAVANLGVFTSSNGQEITVSGKGSISLPTPSGKIGYQISAKTSSAIELLDRLTLTSASFDWDANGIKVAGTGKITAKGGDVGLAFSGSFSGKKSWSLKVDQTSPWRTPDITVSNLSGSLANNNGTVGFTLTGQASQLRLPSSFSISQVSATITNQCPANGGGCTSGAVRLAVDITGSVTLNGSTQQFSGSVKVDLATMVVSLEARINPSNFGPAGLNLTDVTLQYASAGSSLTSGACSSSESNKNAVTFSAKINNLLGSNNLDVIGEINSKGYCLAADLSNFNPTGDSSSSNSFSDVVLIYSSYATEVKLASHSSPIRVAANTAATYGSFAAPAKMSQALGGLSGRAEFSAVLTKQSGSFGFHGEISYVRSSPLYLVGSANSSQTSLSLTSIALAVDYSFGNLEIDLNANGNFYTPSSANGSTAAATVPLTVGVDVNLTRATFGLHASAAGGRPVRDAFGTAGLTLNNLAISGSIGASPSVGVAASAQLPQSWVGSLGVKPGTDIGFVVNVSATNPCFQFSIGKAGQTAPSLDLANKGFVIANYANIVLAPTGCKFADVSIQPGFALDFSGSIAGDALKFHAALTKTSSGFALDADVYLAKFGIGSFGLTDITFKLKLDPSRNILDVNFGATIEVGGSRLDISGGYDRNGSTTVATFALKSNRDIAIAGFEFKNAAVAFEYTSSPSGSSVNFSMSGYFSFLGSSISGTLALTAKNGAVQSVSGDLSVDVDVLVASVNGPLKFSYVKGEGASGSFGPGKVSVFGVKLGISGSLAASGAYKVSADYAIPTQHATAADTWLYANAHGQFNIQFNGNLKINISGGNGKSAALDFTGSQVNIWSQWSTHTWTSYGNNVTLPNAGCQQPFVNGDGVAGTPVVKFWLNPRAVEQASRGESNDSDDNYCVDFKSQVFP